MASPAGAELIRPGSRRFFQVSHVVAGKQGLEPSAVFPSPKQQVESEVKQLELKLVPILDATAADRSSTYYATVLDPKQLFLMGLNIMLFDDFHPLSLEQRDGFEFNLFLF